MQIRSKNDVKQFLSHFKDYVLFPEELEILPIIDNQGNVWNFKYEDGQMFKELDGTKEVIENPLEFVWQNRSYINMSLRA
jgi:hypothetical protein